MKTHEVPELARRLLAQAKAGECSHCNAQPALYETAAQGLRDLAHDLNNAKCAAQLVADYEAEAASAKPELDALVALEDAIRAYGGTPCAPWSAVQRQLDALDTIRGARADTERPEPLPQHDHEQEPGRNEN